MSKERLKVIKNCACFIAIESLGSYRRAAGRKLWIEYNFELVMCRYGQRLYFECCQDRSRKKVKFFFLLSYHYGNEIFPPICEFSAIIISFSVFRVCCVKAKKKTFYYNFSQLMQKFYYASKKSIYYRGFYMIFKKLSRDIKICHNNFASQ